MEVRELLLVDGPQLQLPGGRGGGVGVGVLASLFLLGGLDGQGAVGGGRLGAAVGERGGLLGGRGRLPAPVLLPVRRQVEVVEQGEEDGRVHQQEGRDELGVAAVVVDGLQRVAEHEHELGQLRLGEVLLPPDVLGVLRAHGGQHVVRVEEDVNEVVDEVGEGPVAAGEELDTDPGLDGGERVVVQVQQGDLAVLLAEHKEDRIGELGKLRDIIPPTEVGHSQRHSVLGIIDGLTTVAVVHEPSAHQVLVKHNAAVYDLAGVVYDDYLV